MPRWKKTFDERLWEKVDKRGEDECWEWQGSKSYKYGYGVIRKERKLVYAHRHVYQIVNNEVLDKEIFVCHHCDNPPCCNPKHLFPGTVVDNNRDTFKKGRYASGDKTGARKYPEKMPRGERNGKAKLRESDIREIRNLYAEGGVKYPDLAKVFGVTNTTIMNIVRRKFWKHID